MCFCLKPVYLFKSILEMAAMPFLFNGILLIQCNLPRVLSTLVLKIASCLVPYINSFLILNGEWSSFLFQDFPKVIFLRQIFVIFLSGILHHWRTYFKTFLNIFLNILRALCWVYFGGPRNVGPRK